VNICADGSVYSQASAACLTCPENSFSYSGDITCTHCPPGQYAPKQSAACFSSDKVGGIMRVDLDFTTYRPNDWIRSIAIILETEPSDIHLIDYRSGSVINYFEIEDPNPNELNGMGGNTYNGIRQLSGNEKMLLLFQWYLTDDARISTLPYDIINFKIYSVESNGSNGGNVVTLFAQSDSVQPLPSNGNGNGNGSGSGNNNNGNNNNNNNNGQVTTFEFSLTVDGSSSVIVPSFFLMFFVFIITMLL